MSYQRFLDHYCRVTRIPLKYNPMAHDSDIFLFLKKFSEEDLTKVAKHIRTRYEEKPEIMLSMLRFSYIIRQLDTFGELLGEAIAMGQRRVSERTSVLNSTGRPGEEDLSKNKPARAIGEVARDMTRRMTKEQLDAGWAMVKGALDAPPKDDEEEPPIQYDEIQREMQDHLPLPEPEPEQSCEPEPRAENNYNVEIEEEPANHHANEVVEETPCEQLPEQPSEETPEQS